MLLPSKLEKYLNVNQALLLEEAFEVTTVAFVKTNVIRKLKNFSMQVVLDCLIQYLEKELDCLFELLLEFLN